MTADHRLGQPLRDPAVPRIWVLGCCTGLASWLDVRAAAPLCLCGWQAPVIPLGGPLGDPFNWVCWSWFQVTDFGYGGYGGGDDGGDDGGDEFFDELGQDRREDWGYD